MFYRPIGEKNKVIVLSKRFGQAAVEYLIILAVVIIIALVVVGVLGGFPTLATGVTEKDSLAYWQTADIGIEKPLLRSYGAGSLTIRNNKPFSVTFVNMTYANATNVMNATSKTLSPGQTSTVVAQNGTYNNACGLAAVQDSYAVEITIFYSDASDSTRVYKFVGAKNLVGKCQ